VTPSGIKIFGLMPAGLDGLITVRHKFPYFSDVAVHSAPRIVTQY